MTNSVKFFLNVISVWVLFLGCSKEESGGETKEPEVPVSAVPVSTMEIVTLEVSASLSSEEYQGTLGDETVKLVKIDDSHVMFTVPGDLSEGISTLKVKTLGIEMRYDVSEAELEAGSEEVFGELITELEIEIGELGDTSGADYAQNYIALLESSFNKASEPEKRKAALLYQVNKQWINDILKGNLDEGTYTNVSYNKQTTKQSSSASLSNLIKFKLYVLAAGASGVFAAVAPVDPLSKGLAAVIAVVACVKAVKYHDKLAETELTRLNVLINNLRSQLKQQEQRFEFTHEKEKEVNLKIEQRTFNSSDEGRANENVSIFFSAHNSLNNLIHKLNGIIAYVNEKLFLSDIDEMGSVKINESEPAIVPINSSLFENMNFSVESDKVNINEIEYNEGPQITFQIKDVENSSEEYVDTYLNYSYTDDFNQFSGSFPIRINKEEKFNYQGNWEFELFDGDTPVQYYKWTFDEQGESISNQTMYPVPSEWTDPGDTWFMEYNSYTKKLTLTCDNEIFCATFDFTVNSVDEEDFSGSWNSYTTNLHRVN